MSEEPNSREQDAEVQASELVPVETMGTLMRAEFDVAISTAKRYPSTGSERGTANRRNWAPSESVCGAVCSSLLAWHTFRFTKSRSIGHRCNGPPKV